MEGHVLPKKKKNQKNPICMYVCISMITHTHAHIYMSKETGAHQVIVFPKVNNGVNTDSAG